MTFVISCFSTSFMDFNSSLRVFYSLVHWGYEQFTIPQRILYIFQEKVPQS